MSGTTTSVNIVCMDHYLHAPTKDLDPFMSEFRAATIERLPIIRIYGSTYEGVKACVHIHGVFPYFYVKCEKDCDNPSAVAYQLASALDKAINITLNQASSSQQHIYSITVENGIPFYGYHSEDQPFFKLSFYNPTMIKRASALLQSGNILGTAYQPFECHIPYKQQFMIDYNLFGMNFVKFSNARYRDDVTTKKQSVCPLEFDVLATEILNRFDVTPGNVACNPGIQYIRDEELKRDGKAPDERVECNLTQNRVDVEPTITDLNYREKLRMLLKSRASQKSSGTSAGNLSASFLDVSLLDSTQLEEQAQMFLDLWKANQPVGDVEDDEEEDLDEDCVLSQRAQSKPASDARDDAPDDGREDGGDELNFTLLDFMSSLELKEFDEPFGLKTP